MNKQELIVACKKKGINVNWHWYSEKDLERMLESGIQPIPLVDYLRYAGAIFMLILAMFFTMAWIMSLVESEITSQVTYLGANVFFTSYIAKLLFPPKRDPIPNAVKNNNAKNL